MRHDATDAEHLMWQILRAKRFMNLKFRRQHVIEPYIVDFYCHELSLVVELDGGQHNTDDSFVKQRNFLEKQSDLDLAIIDIHFYNFFLKRI